MLRLTRRPPEALGLRHSLAPGLNVSNQEKSWAHREEGVTLGVLVTDPSSLKRCNRCRYIHSLRAANIWILG